MAALAAALGLGSQMGCRPLITINPDTGQRAGDEERPLCQRVVSRMIRCSTDRDYRDHLRQNRDRAVSACETHGRKDAERCDKEETCESFSRCLGK